MMSASTTTRARTIEIDDARLELFASGDLTADTPVVCASHPASVFGADTVQLLARASKAVAVCINPRGLGGSTPASRCTLEQMVDDLEIARQRLELPPWLFWGMSGGGWLALSYAHRHPEGLTGIVVESACACFRQRLRDPSCVLSPAFDAWREPLTAAGLFDERAHDDVGDPDDTVWIDLEGVGQVFARRDGPALLVSPGRQPPEMLAAMPVLWTFDARSWIQTVRTPALVMAGTADPIVPLARARSVHDALPDSRFVAIDGAGHVPTAEQRPEAGAAVRSFSAEIG